MWKKSKRLCYHSRCAVQWLHEIRFPSVQNPVEGLQKHHFWVVNLGDVYEGNMFGTLEDRGFGLGTAFSFNEMEPFRHPEVSLMV